VKFSRSDKIWGSGAAFTVLALAFLWPKAPNPHTGPRPPTDVQVAEAWLQCIDCRGSFLKRISELRGESKETVTRLFSTSLTDGPGARRLARREAALRRTWLADSMYRVSHGLPVLNRDSIVATYLRGFQVIWRVRAAVGLGVIGGDAAVAALNSPLNLSLHDRGDSIILRAVQEAKSDSARKVLKFFVPGHTKPVVGTASVSASDSATDTSSLNTSDSVSHTSGGGTSDSVSGTGRISGRVVIKVEKSPLRNAQVEVEGGGLSRNAMTGSNGEYTIDHVPAGIHLTIRARMLGYLAGKDTVTVVAGQTSNRDFNLKPLH